MNVPITGIVGVLGGSAEEIARQLADLQQVPALRPDAIEIRADLFDDLSDAVDVLGRLPREFRTIFTVRLPEHGGRYAGKESRRLALYRQALESGAALIDAEWESECARALTADGAPVVLSHHDFGGMPNTETLEEITARMTGLGALAIKLVPTATTSLDAATMLQWVASGSKDGPRRVGFAMGQAGVPSRVLSLAWGAPWTYAALGDAVAPGLLSVRDLEQTFRVRSLTRATRLFGVLVPGGDTALGPIAQCRVLNRALATRELDAVFLPFQVEKLRDLTVPLATLPFEAFTVPGPLEAEALQLALEYGSASAAASDAGGADTLLVRRGPGGTRTFAADQSRSEKEQLEALLGDETRP